MSKRQLLLILGVWVILFLFLGIPAAGDKIIAVLTGLIIIFVAYGLKSEAKVRRTEHMPYVEHRTEPSEHITNNNPPMSQ